MLHIPVKYSLTTFAFTLLIGNVLAAQTDRFKSDTCQIPTILTPNDDGQNDEFIIPCIPNIYRLNQSELAVFTEWGEVILRQKPYNNDWAGTYKTLNPLPDGTYYYIFKLTPTTEPQRGFVTIFR
jgi:gliding motility-associated-like protein